jgi:hypothetical protein
MLDGETFSANKPPVIRVETEEAGATLAGLAGGGRRLKKGNCKGCR